MLRSLLLSVLILAVTATLHAQEKYASYQAAYSAGSKLIRDGRLAEAQVALEAAVPLAKTDSEKLNIQRALLIPYRELQDIEPMRKASEYVIANTAIRFEPENTRTMFLQFANKRGKLDAVMKEYAQRHTKYPDERLPLLMLTEAFGQLRPYPEKSVEYGEKLMALDTKLKIEPSVYAYTEIARQMVLAKKYQAGAELFEKMAPVDKKLEAWYLKEAALAWLKADDKTKAMAAVKKSLAATPETRSGLDYSWHESLGDALVSLGDPASALKQFEEAMKLTKIEFYKKNLEKKIADAKTALIK